MQSALNVKIPTKPIIVSNLFDHISSLRDDHAFALKEFEVKRSLNFKDVVSIMKGIAVMTEIVIQYSVHIILLKSIPPSKESHKIADMEMNSKKNRSQKIISCWFHRCQY